MGYQNNNYCKVIGKSWVTQQLVFGMYCVVEVNATLW